MQRVVLDAQHLNEPHQASKSNLENGKVSGAPKISTVPAACWLSG